MRIPIIFALLIGFITTTALGYGEFVATGSLDTPRDARMIAALPDGRAVVFGGTQPEHIRAEIYDPVSGTWAYGDSMLASRIRGIAVTLADGRVLVAGGLGENPSGGSRIPLASAEIYDPAADEFTATGDMGCARFDLAATLLPDGTVLVVGGAYECNGSRAVACAEIYDPAAGSFTAVDDLNVARQSPTSNLMGDDRVLVAGGVPGTGNCGASMALRTAEIYHPATGSFTLLASEMSDRRYEHRAVTLPEGRVLVTGGQVSSYTGAARLASADLFDYTTETFTPVGPMSLARVVHGMGILPAGEAIVMGGIYVGDVFTDIAEVFDAGTGTFTVLDSLMTAPRGYFGYAGLEDGCILIAGGNLQSGATETAELFVPEREEVPAAVDLKPEVLNPRSHGRWMTCYIELPEGYDPAGIDVSTVMLNGAVACETRPTSVGDYDSDGVPDRMVKFPRSDVAAVLPCGDEVEVMITGEVGDQPFVGMDTIRVLCETPAGPTPVRRDSTAGPHKIEVVNPSTPGDGIHMIFSVPDHGHVALSIYDANGRMIGTLVDTDLPVGSYWLSWDPTHDLRRELTSGMYFIRLESGDRIATGKLILVR